MTGPRRLSFFALSRWVSTLSLSKSARALLRMFGEVVDAWTGRTHPRYPITVEGLAARLGCARSTVQRATRELESAGLVERHESRKQYAHGHWRQAPNSYGLRLPDDVWHVLDAVESTPIAREPKPTPPRERYTSPAAMVLSVRGKQSTRDAETPLVRERKPRPYDVKGCTADLVTPDELAAELVHEGCVAAETCSEERRFVAVASLYELSRRAVEVAGEASDLGMTSSRARAAVRQWVVRCLANAEQKVESVSHALNILRRFMVSAAMWEEPGELRGRQPA